MPSMEIDLDWVGRTEYLELLSVMSIIRYFYLSKTFCIKLPS